MVDTIKQLPNLHKLQAKAFLHQWRDETQYGLVCPIHTFYTLVKIGQNATILFAIISYL
jgi:hypothetical protein